MIPILQVRKLRPEKSCEGGESGLYYWNAALWPPHWGSLRPSAQRGGITPLQGQLRVSSRVPRVSHLTLWLQEGTRNA